MSQLSAVKFIDTVANFFKQMGIKIGLEMYLYVFGGLLLAGIIVAIVLVRFSYEVKTLRSVEKLNEYFKKQPFIDENNLVEFNNKIKKAPQAIRVNWQQYMLNREEGPSKYINIDSCVEKPLRTSSIDKQLKNIRIFTYCLVALSILLTAFTIPSTLGIGVTIGYIAIIPAVLILIHTIFSLILLSWKNAAQADLYQNFHNFQRNLNKSVSTLPAYVDYEILFTAKEIKKNSPLLQEYIEKRALMEQEEIEKARLENEETEKFNFEDLGINASLLLERAMKECEKYLSSKKRLKAECDQIETEKDNYKKNYDTAMKDYQRKLQASRENLERLKSQQEASTNRIESNYIRKQQADEMKKQELVEKENDEASVKFNEEQDALVVEIEKRKADIEEKRLGIENAMKAEFKTYATSIYKEIETLVNKNIKEEISRLKDENKDLRELAKSLQNTETTDASQFIKNNQPQKEEKQEEFTFDPNKPFFDAPIQPLYQEEEPKEEKTEVEEVVSNGPLFVEEPETEETEVETEVEDVDDSDTDAGRKQEDQEVEEEVEEEAEEEEAEEEVEEENEEGAGVFKDSSAVKSGSVTEDELELLQRQIEEENAKLFNHKKALEKEVDAIVPTTVVEQPKEETKEKQQRKPRAQSKLSAKKPVKKSATKTTKAPAKKTASKPAVKKVEAKKPVAKKTTVATKPATKKAPTKKATTVAKAPVKKVTAPKTTAKKSVEKKSTAKADIRKEIDMISAEMENLLKNVKKKL